MVLSVFKCYFLLILVLSGIDIIMAAGGAEFAPMGMAVIMGGGAMIAGGQGSQKKDEIPWYDLWHNYFVLPPEYTTTVDKILMNPKHGYLRQKEVRGPGLMAPGMGTHFYYRDRDCWYDFNYIRLIKTRVKEGEREVEYYRCLVGPFSEPVRKDMEKIMFTIAESRIQVISIDTSTPVPRTLVVTQKYNKPRLSQKRLVKAIVKSFLNVPNHNIKICICGVRGTGKSSIGKMVKRFLDTRIVGENEPEKRPTKLFHNFDPKQVGVNIESMVLTNADSSDVIVMMDELDIILNDVTTPAQMFGDARLQHTKDKSSFNAMMDAIDNSPNTIAIFTTEKTPEELHQNQDHLSFMRPGRIDYFVTLTKDDVTFIRHPQCPDPAPVANQ